MTFVQAIWKAIKKLYSDTLPRSGPIVVDKDGKIKRD